MTDAEIRAKYSNGEDVGTEEIWRRYCEDMDRQFAEKIKRWTGKDLESNFYDDYANCEITYIFNAISLEKPIVIYRTKKPPTKSGLHFWDNVDILPEYHAEWKEHVRLKNEIKELDNSRYERRKEIGNEEFWKEAAEGKWELEPWKKRNKQCS